MSKKAERRRRTAKVVRKRREYVNRIYKNKAFVDRPLDIPAKAFGRCKKHHPFDCGKSGCYACHCDKLDNIPSRQQAQSDLTFCEESEGYNHA